MTVGACIQAAIERGKAHERGMKDRVLKVRVLTCHGDDDGGLTIRARIAARNNDELVWQDDLGLRRVAWDELDARAHELVHLVDEAVAEVQLAIGRAGSA